MSARVDTLRLTTPEGHTLQMFYNADERLLVVDVVHKDDECGNEIVRRRLDFDELFAHVIAGSPGGCAHCGSMDKVLGWQSMDGRRCCSEDCAVAAYEG